MLAGCNGQSTVPCTRMSSKCGTSFDVQVQSEINNASSNKRVGILLLNIMSCAGNFSESFPDSWYGDWESECPIDMAALLRSDLLADQRNFEKLRAIVLMVSGPISFTSSAAIVYHILRSYKGLSTSYHRLVFGLCVTDMITSLTQALSSVLTPQEVSYFTPFAKGNVSTCDAQGFLVVGGYICASLYNSSMCFYYLAIIKYNKKDDFIATKLEPWFHSIPVIVGYGISSVLLALDQFNNPNGGICFPIPNDPPHCIGHDDGYISPGNFTIPCGRGRENYTPVLLLAVALPSITTPVVIVSTMALMYITVTRIEKRNQAYGVHSLRQRVQQRSSGNNNLLDRLTRASGQTTNHTSRRDYILTMRSNRANNNKRSIMHMAMGYALTWILTWGPMLIFLFAPSHFTGFLVSGIAPLQGFFNIIVYMAPKVRNAKNSKRQKITWPQAIWKVWTSKGNRPVTRGLNRQNATRRMSISAVLRKWFKFW